MVIVLFFVGLIGNIIGTLAGGSGLLTLPTMLLLGVPTHSAIGANKVSSLANTLTAILTVVRKKQLAKEEFMPIFIIGSLGGITGGVTASFLSAKALTFIAIALLMFAFVLSVLGKTNFGKRVKLTLSKKMSALLLAIGFYDGLFGPGSGTLFIYVFASEKLTYMKCVLLGRVGVFSTCLGAAIVYILSGYILWYETVFLTVGSILGAQIGMRLVQHISNKAAQLILRFITFILIIQLVIEFMTH